ncbi:MAG TPA: pantoate--beta-alanine ligase [Chryseosolibacter sp.]|nr:pantoate--beta-alanine ligase [Chryseosolibacter sp.]
MKIFKQIAPLKAFLKDIKQQSKSIGLVPTMGALHQGHLTLIRASKAQNDVTVATIYVNPTQFNNSADLQKYPRSLDTDTQMLSEVQCDVVFCPDDHEMYPVESTITMDFGQLDKVMEGHFRPGHFSGVGIIVSKLFHIIEPDNAYFGQKDWQQFAVISQLKNQLMFNLKLHSVPTLREPDGLALSSRNLRLNAEQRQHADVFFKALTKAQTDLKAGASLENVKNDVKKMVENIPGTRLEYFEVADSQNLNLLSNVSESTTPIMCIAGYVGDVRLIDNMFFELILI